MSTILAMETSLGECSVALWHEGGVAAEAVETTRNRQTEKLIPMVESVLIQSGCALKEITQWVTTAGPGSFTGIRIALAAARSFTLATGAPTLAVSTLELLAWQAYTALPASKEPIAVFINAYRGEVYTQIFTYEDKIRPLSEALALSPEDARLLAAQHHATLYAGDAATLVMEQEVTSALKLPSAASLAGYVALHSLNPEAYLPQPLYIRAPDAKVQETYLMALNAHP